MHFEPTQKNISDFFYNEHKIPFHQRSYIWSAEVLKEFWEDIHYVHENRNRNTCIFRLDYHNKNYNSNNIIDGQQRITTLVLFVLATVKTLWDELERKIHLNIETQACLEKSGKPFRQDLKEIRMKL